MSEAFQDLFLPNGQAPLSGLFSRRVDLAAVLDAVAVKGISEFYSGHLAQEMAAAVRKNIFALIISNQEFCRDVSTLSSSNPSKNKSGHTFTSAFHALLRY